MKRPLGIESTSFRSRFGVVPVSTWGRSGVASGSTCGRFGVFPGSRGLWLRQAIALLLRRSSNESTFQCLGCVLAGAPLMTPPSLLASTCSRPTSLSPEGWSYNRVLHISPPTQDPSSMVSFLYARCFVFSQAVPGSTTSQHSDAKSPSLPAEAGARSPPRLDSQFHSSTWRRQGSSPTKTAAGTRRRNQGRLCPRWSKSAEVASTMANSA